MNNDSTSRNDIWKWLALLIIAVFSIYVTFPVAEKLRFGLDLKGGTSFTLGIDQDKLRETIIAANPALTNETGACFADLAASAPAWLFRSDWNLLKATRRGPVPAGEWFQADVRPRSFALMFR